MSHRLAWLATPGCGAVSEHAGGIMTELDTFSSYIRCFMQKPELRRALADVGYQHWQASYQWRDVLQGWIEVIEQGALTRSFSMPDAIRKSMASRSTGSDRGDATGCHGAGAGVADDTAGHGGCGDE